MGMYMRMKYTKDLVMQIMQNKPETRSSDMGLYLEVCKELNPDVISLPFQSVICNLSEYGLPGFETVRRSRQKIQEKHPELCANTAVTEYRRAAEEEVREFVRNY